MARSFKQRYAEAAKENLEEDAAYKRTTIYPGTLPGRE